MSNNRSQLTKGVSETADSVSASRDEVRTSGRLQVLKTYKIYIDGKFPRTESGRYYELKLKDSTANMSLSSRKDFRDAVTGARTAWGKWSAMAAYNRGQILYRIAEMLETRRAQFVEELVQQGATETAAHTEVTVAVDRLVYYAGWADKYQQVFGSVNPVASSHFNFSLLEPIGVVAVMAPEDNSLVGLVSAVAPVIVGGNTCVVLASHSKPLCAVTWAEVLNSSDVPSGVVNILTGVRKELLGHFSTHMDVNGLVYCGSDSDEIKTAQLNGVSNLKRVCIYRDKDWLSDSSQSPYMILETQEVKTTWHPVGI